MLATHTTDTHCPVHVHLFPYNPNCRKSLLLDSHLFYLLDSQLKYLKL